MSNKNRIYYFSHLILFVTGAAYILDIITGEKLTDLFLLQSSLILKDLEWWRIFTFPLAVDSIESTILFMFTFFIFAPKLEEIFRNWFYPVLLAIITCLQGAILTLFLSKSNIVITGMEGLSFFVLTFFTLINIKKRLIIFNKLYIHASVFTLGMILIWFSMVFLHSIYVESYKPVFEGLYNAVFGISAGFTIYLLSHAKISKQPVKKKAISDQPVIPKPEELSLAVIAKNEIKKFNERLQEEFTRTDSWNHSPEERLNEILDKINGQGKESLSPGELKFLEDYSRNL